MHHLLMILTTAALAQDEVRPQFTAAASDCEIASHEIALTCKKGACRVEESLSYYKPDCRGRLYFEYDAESVDALVETERGWVVAAPCSGANDRYCVEDVGASARVVRRWDMPALGAEAGFDVIHDGSASFTIKGAEAWDTNEGFSVRSTKPVKKAPTPSVWPEASNAMAASSRFGGPLDRGLRDGTWLMVHTDGHPLMREMTYEQGVRVMLGDWQARTSTDSAGRVTPVPELSECPRDARVDTQLGKLLTQSCTWTTEAGLSLIHI